MATQFGSGVSLQRLPFPSHSSPTATAFVLTMNAGENRFNAPFVAALNAALDAER